MTYPTPKSDDLDHLKRRNSKLWRENQELRRTVERLRSQVDTTPPTLDEAKAMHVLQVSLSQLRTWAKQGRGPQPPYDDVEAWVSWVEGEVAR